MWHDRFSSALNGDTFWPLNRTFNAQKMVKETSLGAKGRLFQILNTVINQKMQEKNSVSQALKTTFSSVFILAPRGQRHQVRQQSLQRHAVNAEALLTEDIACTTESHREEGHPYRA